jgi:hypothetical protein
MFKLEILQQIGKPPQVIEASQVVIRMPNGTPVCVAALYGSDQTILVSHCKDNSFVNDLNKLGINETVIVERLDV